MGVGTGQGNEVRNNLIDETGRFPEDTGGPANHIYQMNLSDPPLCHDNRIVGLPASFIFDPGIGQRIRDSRNVHLESD